MSGVRAEAAGKIHPLTSLRFFAALYVVVYHTLGNLAYGRFVPANIDTPHPADAAPNFVSRLLSLGYVSVSFFFLLSGYILAIVYLGKGRPVARRKFFVARIARIYPLFFLTLLMDTPWAFHFTEKISSPSHALAKIPVVFGVESLMLHAWLIKLGGIDFPNWSLSAEAFFYLSFPFIGAALWRLRGTARWAVAGGLYVGGQILVYAWTQHFSRSPVQVQPLLHLSTFALGILLASWQSERSGDPLGTSRRVSAHLLLAFSVLLYVATVQISPEVPYRNLGDGLLAPIFMALIWALSAADTIFSRLLSASWLVVLGEASFGLYLLHIPVLHIFEAVHPIAQPWAYAIYLVLCIVLSVLSFFYVEDPLRRLVLARLSERPREPLEAASIAQ